MKAFIIRTANWLLRHTAFMWSDSMFVHLQFWINNGYRLDLNHPKTFCEKIQWLKLNNRREEFTKMVDKVDVKEYVASVIGSQYIIPTLGVWNSFDEIDFNELPDGFILKCAHDSSKGVVCRDKTALDKKKVKRRMEFFQRKTFYKQNREYPYKNVPHRLIAEKFLVNGTDSELKDYKFYCFNGRAEYCQLIANRSTDETIDFYDRDWKHQEFIGLLPIVHHAPIAHHASTVHHTPEHYNQMLEVADKLASSINTPFVRIDLYNVNGKIYFGEITFFPNSGIGKFSPDEWNMKLGDYINLENRKQND